MISSPVTLCKTAYISFRSTFPIDGRDFLKGFAQNLYSSCHTTQTCLFPLDRSPVVAIPLTNCEKARSSKRCFPHCVSLPSGGPQRLRNSDEKIPCRPVFLLAWPMLSWGSCLALLWAYTDDPATSPGVPVRSVSGSSAGLWLARVSRTGTSSKGSIEPVYSGLVTIFTPNASLLVAAHIS